VRAADSITFGLRAGERLGIAGESGSGKSTMALSLLRLIKPPGRIESGEIWLEDRDLLTLSDEEMRRLRLARIALVPQGSMNSLNPVLRVRDQFADALRDHGVRTETLELERRVRDLLQRVGLDPEVAGVFPHQLSGGMKQRVCIAVAICLSPRVIVADEPTSALDVVVQKQVMETLGRAQADLGASVILVGHDMGLMAQFVDRLGVMYAGKLVELSPVPAVFREPLHPYTRMLIASLPSLERKDAFQGIPGLPPPLQDLPGGCAFHPRCPLAVERCRTEVPVLREVRPDGWAACHLA
jgi:peptide/nickel transport system ATP-binding protein